ncbi:MAG: 6-carboxytetrahydropterin synthase [Flavobacteriales bacterium]
MYLTRRERFSAAHRLFRPEWTDEQNTAVFGGCANPNWHGHNYNSFFLTNCGLPRSYQTHNELQIRVLCLLRIKKTS